MLPSPLPPGEGMPAVDWRVAVSRAGGGATGSPLEVGREAGGPLLDSELRRDFARGPAVGTESRKRGTPRWRQCTASQLRATPSQVSEAATAAAPTVTTNCPPRTTAPGVREEPPGSSVCVWHWGHGFHSSLWERERQGGQSPIPKPNWGEGRGETLGQIGDVCPKRRKALCCPGSRRCPTGTC